MKRHTSGLFWVCYALVMLGLCYICGCRFTSTVPVNPSFNISRDSLLTSLKKISDFQNIEIQGALTRSTGSPDKSELTVKLINPGDISLADDQKINERCLQVAMKIRQSLQSPDAFDSYKILFEERKREDGVSTSSYKGAAFKSSELSAMH